MSDYTNLIHSEGSTTDDEEASSYYTDIIDLDVNNDDNNDASKRVCPTCQGKGKLTQSQADNLVALIPARDKRLRPRRTKLYLGITVAISAICLILVALFLWPRTVYVSIIDTRSVKIYMPMPDKVGDPYIDVQIRFQLNNENYFEAKVTDLEVGVTWNKLYTLTTTTKKHPPIVVAGRSVNNCTVIATEVFDGIVGNKARIKCSYGWKWTLFQKFDFKATISTFLRSEQVKDTYYGYIRCHSNTDEG